jgi:capsule polysaccharide export protein KpsE/RkpR
MYVNTFVTPVAPQQAQYPKRGLYTALVAVGSFAAWGLLCALALLARNHMA